MNAVTHEVPVPYAGGLGPEHWRYGMCCCICGSAIQPWQRFNWDHQVPMAKGGRRGRANKDYAHVVCNSVKGDRWPFSLRTEQDRDAVRAWVKPRVWRRLQRIWNGGED